MRCVAHHLPDVSSGFRHTFRRCKATTARKPPNARVAAQTHKYLEPSHSKARFQLDGDALISEELRKVLSPEACGWLEGKPYDGSKGKKPAFEPSIPDRGVASPSNEKAAFDALETTQHDTFMSVDDADLYSEAKERVPAGTLVEIRRNDKSAFGVVLFTILSHRRWNVHTLSPSGEIWSHHEHDVTFQIPDFVPKKLIEDCGMFPVVQSASEMAARVEVLTQLRTFQKQFERQSHSIPEIARRISFYDQVVHPDPTKWSRITIREAAEILLKKPQSDLEPLDLYVVQSYLFSASELFVVEARNFANRQYFWVRPRQDIADIRAVHRMVLRKERALDSFIEKARAVAQDNKKRAFDSRNEPPTRQPISGVEWTADDKTILRFMKGALETRRFIQEDHHEICLAHILKRLGVVPVNDDYDSKAAHAFAIDLGLLPPWEDLTTREGSSRERYEDINLTPTTSTPIIPQTLGANDLYSSDIVESVRHDFGSLPAYVIDDWGAEELDDAVSVERIPSDPGHTWVHVHVADPTTLLPPTHEIARHAMAVGSTHYFVDRTVPMLPRAVDFHQYSLGSSPGKPQVAMTFSIKVDSDGSIVDYRVRPSVIRNARVVRYDEVDALLGNPLIRRHYPFGDPEPNPYPSTASALDASAAEDLRLLRAVTRKLSQKRAEAGALVFGLSVSQVAISLRPLPSNIMGIDVPCSFQGFPQLSYSVGHTLELGARDMIAECAKSAARVASMFFRDRDIPALRRTVGPLYVERRGGLETLLKTRTEGCAVDIFDVLRTRVSAPAGKYVTTPAMHSLMGIRPDEGYIKVTSPLRRFSDIVAHWQIKHALLAEKNDRTSPFLFDESWLLKVAREFADYDVDSRRMESRQQHFWALTYLSRWMNDPARDERAHDPLRNLKGCFIEELYIGKGKIVLQGKVYIPELGLPALLIGWPRDKLAQIGDELDVEVLSIELGSAPTLTVRPRNI